MNLRVLHKHSQSNGAPQNQSMKGESSFIVSFMFGGCSPNYNDIYHKIYPDFKMK